MKQRLVRLAILNDGVNGRFPHCRLFRRIIVVVEAALLVLVPVEHGSLLLPGGPGHSPVAARRARIGRAETARARHTWWNATQTATRDPFDTV